MEPDTEVQWLTDDEQATWRAFNMAGRLVDGALDRQLIREADMGQPTTQSSSHFRRRPIAKPEWAIWQNSFSILRAASVMLCARWKRTVGSSGGNAPTTDAARSPFLPTWVDGPSNGRPPDTSKKYDASCLIRSRRPNKNTFARFATP